MDQQQAQKIIMPNKTLVTIFSNKNNLYTVATKRPLILNGRSEGSKPNLEFPTETKFSALLRPIAGKQRLLFKFSNSIIQNGPIQAQPYNKIK
jgi:hypothetical protein